MRYYSVRELFGSVYLDKLSQLEHNNDWLHWIGHEPYISKEFLDAHGFYYEQLKGIERKSED